MYRIVGRAGGAGAKMKGWCKDIIWVIIVPVDFITDSFHLVVDSRGDSKLGRVDSACAVDDFLAINCLASLA